MMKKKGKVTDQDPSRLTDIGPSPTEEAVCYTFDDYQCTGNIQLDFPKLCALLDFKKIPRVISKTLETEGEEQPEENVPRATTVWSKPHLHVDLENKNPLSAKSVKIMGWKVHVKIAQVLNKILPHLSRLESLYFWQAGLTDEMVKSLSNTVSLGCSLRYVYLDANPLPNHSYYLLLSEDSVITRLFLRSNEIGDEGARLIGSALSTAKTSNKNLQFLNLAFNCIGDAGAAYLAQGLRLNRALLYLSLTNNRITDSGAAQFSKVLREFPLTHEEVVERRRLLFQKEAEKMGLNFGADTDQPDEEQDGRSSVGKPDNKVTAKKKEMAKKEEKPEKGAAKKDNVKKGAQKNPKAPEKAPPAKGGKAVGKKKPAPPETPEEKSFTELVESKVEIVNPLLDPHVQCRDGQVFLPGNTILMYLSLAGNTITEKSLPLFLTSLEQQTKEGLLRLLLNRNDFPPDCELYLKINKLLQHRNPFNKPKTEAAAEEEPH